MVKKPVLTDLDFGRKSRVKNIPDPVEAYDAVNKRTIDGILVEGGRQVPIGGATGQVLKRINISEYNWADEDNNLDGGYF